MFVSYLLRHRCALALWQVAIVCGLLVAVATAQAQPSALDAFVADEGAFLNNFEHNKRLNEEIIQAEIAFQLTRARSMLDADPNAAIAELKLSLENLERTPDMSAEVRAQNPLFWHKSVLLGTNRRNLSWRLLGTGNRG